MEHVYVVLSEYFGDHRVHAIFKTEESAKAYIEAYVKSEKYPFELFVQKWVVK